jgi:hypothetical protein
MRTLLFCTSHFQSAPPGKYVFWAEQQRRFFNNCDLLIINDGPVDASLKEKTHRSSDPISLVDFRHSLGRVNNDHFPGWYRSFRTALLYGKNSSYGKIIHIEADAFIVSQRLADFILTLDSGWHSLYTSKYFMPESAIQIVCRDAYSLIDQLPSEQIPDRPLELQLPIQHVHKEFLGDRVEDSSTPDEKLDYVCQWDFRRDFNSLMPVD